MTRELKKLTAAQLLKRRKAIARQFAELRRRQIRELGR